MVVVVAAWARLVPVVAVAGLVVELAAGAAAVEAVAEAASAPGLEAWAAPLDEPIVVAVVCSVVAVPAVAVDEDFVVHLTAGSGTMAAAELVAEAAFAVVVVVVVVAVVAGPWV